MTALKAQLTRTWTKYYVSGNYISEFCVILLAVNFHVRKMKEKYKNNSPCGIWQVPALTAVDYHVQGKAFDKNSQEEAIYV